MGSAASSRVPTSSKVTTPAYEGKYRNQAMKTTVPTTTPITPVERRSTMCWRTILIGSIVVLETGDAGFGLDGAADVRPDVSNWWMSS